MNQRINFENIPEEWGILVPRTGHYRNLKNTDLKLLRELRERFRDEYYGKPVPYKEAFKDKTAERALNRLWGAGFIEKFSTTFHTQSGRPNYVSWYIWEDLPRMRVNSQVPQFSNEDLT